MAVAPLATCVWAATRAPRVLDGDVLTESYRWVPGLGLELSFRLDAFALLMLTLVSGIGVLVLWYATWYFGAPRPRLGYFAGCLTAFAGAMLGLVLADDVFAIFLFWELTSITSFLLIGFEDRESTARAAALRALLVTSAGALAMLAGLVLLSQAAGTSSLAGIVDAAPRGGTVAPALFLVILGAATKSAQVPFHFWLPGAMVAPTPVSAYLHSATMVKAGVYLIARFAPAFADVGIWRPLVLGLGLTSMLVGAWLALSRHDLKALLAYGTISQLGFLVVLFGAGEPALTTAGCAVLLAHGLFKAALFMVAGIVDHQAHTRDLRRLTGLRHRMPVVAATTAIAAASMAAVPPLLGFLAKEKAYDALLEARFSLAGAVAAGVIAGSMLTVAYSVRFLVGTFGDRAAPGAEPVGPDVARPARAFVAPVALLAGATLVFGLVPNLVNPLVQEAARALDPAAGTKGLVLWPGVNPALLFSALTLVVGLAIATAEPRIERVQAWAGRGRLSGTGVYDALVARVLLGAARLTGAIQSGSLPRYLVLVLLTVLALPGVALVRHARMPEGLTFAESPLQVAAAAMIVVAALATVTAAQRFVAVLCVGAVGYGVAVLFAIQGGPDLALVQVLVETLAVIVFVLVLRRLPDRFPVAGRPRLVASRAVLAVVTGAFAALFVLVAAGARVEPSVSEAMLDRSLPDAGGRNVVNVILVDFRGFDTLGEITVLLVASLGITSLVLARRVRDRAGGDS